MRTFLPYPSDVTAFSSEYVSSRTVIASVVLLWLLLSQDAVLLNIPRPLPRWHAVHRYAAGLPLFCRMRTTPGNHRKHRPEALRCNRPGDSVNRRYGHHGRRLTAEQTLLYHCPAVGLGRGYHWHGLYRASTHTGAGRHTEAPATQQRRLSSAPAWRGSAPPLTTV